MTEHRFPPSLLFCAPLPAQLQQVVLRLGSPRDSEWLARNPHLARDAWFEMYNRTTSLHMAKLLVGRRLSQEQIDHAIVACKERRVGALEAMLEHNELSDEQLGVLARGKLPQALAARLFDDPSLSDASRLRILPSLPSEQALGWLLTSPVMLEDLDPVVKVMARVRKPPEHKGHALILRYPQLATRVEPSPEWADAVLTSGLLDHDQQLAWIQHAHLHADLRLHQRRWLAEHPSVCGACLVPEDADPSDPHKVSPAPQSLSATEIDELMVVASVMSSNHRNLLLQVLIVQLAFNPDLTQTHRQQLLELRKKAEWLWRLPSSYFPKAPGWTRALIDGIPEVGTVREMLATSLQTREPPAGEGAAVGTLLHQALGDDPLAWQVALELVMTAGPELTIGEIADAAVELRAGARVG
jgi:hypothetical protein